MPTTALPADLEQILDLIAHKIVAYGHLKWNERDMLKSDMMVVPARWTPSRITPEAMRERLAAGGAADDAATGAAELLRQAQSGRRLRPTAMYRGFRFTPDPDENSPHQTKPAAFR